MTGCYQLGGISLPQVESLEETLNRVEVEFLDPIEETGKPRDEILSKGIDNCLYQAVGVEDNLILKRYVNLKDKGRMDFSKIQKLLSFDDTCKAVEFAESMSTDFSVIKPSDLFEDIYNQSGNFSYVGTYLEK